MGMLMKTKCKSRAGNVKVSDKRWSQRRRGRVPIVFHRVRRPIPDCDSFFARLERESAYFGGLGRPAVHVAEAAIGAAEAEEVAPEEAADAAESEDEDATANAVAALMSLEPRNCR